MKKVVNKAVDWTKDRTKSGNFVQIDRELFKGKVSAGAMSLYVVLTELEYRFTTGRESKENYFWRTANELATDTGMAIQTIRKYRKELEKAGLIETWKHHPPIHGNTGHGPDRKAAVIAFRLKHEKTLQADKETAGESHSDTGRGTEQMAIERNDRVLTTQQAADYLHTTKQTVLKMTRDGKLKANKIGREFRFLQEELDKYLRRE
jgi:excisionase family DNA binding protein